MTSDTKWFLDDHKRKGRVSFVSHGMLWASVVLGQSALPLILPELREDVLPEGQELDHSSR